MEKQKTKNNMEKQKAKKKQEKPRKRPGVVSIGDRKLVGVRYINKQPHVNIRAYSRDEHGRMFSTKRGIMLSLTEWNQLKKQFAAIDNVFNC
jgi:hypothetical protein